MKKWIGLYLGLFLAVLIVGSGIAGLHTMKQAEFGAVCNAEGYASQIWTLEDSHYVLYQNPEQKKFQIADIENENKEAVGTVHQNGVYAVFRYTDGEQQFFGIEPLGTVKEEQQRDRKQEAQNQEEMQIPVFAAKGEFLAAGSNSKAVFCSVLGEDGRTITEYMLLNGSDEWLEKQSFIFSRGHFVLCAAYGDDALWLVSEDGRVYAYTMALQETEIQTADTVLWTYFQNEPADGAGSLLYLYAFRHSAGQCLLLAALLAAILTLLIYGVRKENHIVFRILCCTEILCMAALLCVSSSFTAKLTQAKVLEIGIEAGHVLEEMKGNQRADGTVKPEFFWKALQQREGLLEDLLFISPEDGKVLLSKTLPAGVTIGEYYNAEKTDALLTAVLEGNDAVMTRLEKGGRKVYTVAMRDWTDRTPDAVLLAVLSEQGIHNSIAATTGLLRNGVYMLMAAVTAAHGLLFIYFSNRWKKFREGIVYVAQEKKEYPDAPKLADGLQEAWMPLEHIGSTLNRLYYERDLLYRSYYKFVPKGMDRLLRKSLLADIEIGDRKTLRGCMVYIALGDMKQLKGAEYFEAMTKNLELMHRVREQRDGIFLSASTDLQQRKVFFEQDADRAVQFSVDLMHAYAENGILTDNDLVMLLHVAEFEYGISGVKDMMTPYMYSAQESVLQPYARALAKAKVRIALTEQTLTLVDNTFYTRYIGFITDKVQGRTLKLYECLDAYSELHRKLMQETDTMFQKGLELLYSNDFYLARNTFNEVLKLNEQDYVARWYLFRCEYYLNHPEADLSYGLFEAAASEQTNDVL